MVVQGEKPSVLSYGALLIALENGKLFVEEHMIKVGVLPNLYAYTIIALVYNRQASVSDSLNLSNDVVANLKINIEEVLSKDTRNIGTISIDALRWAIVTVEDYLASGTRLFSKCLLLWVYSAIEVLETYLGVDPNDPIVPFFLFVGTTVALGISYRALTYGGYSWDLSPESALDLLAGRE
ncbi:hypothetical protein GIB67_035307 [Kingdonia uniflora]|uniref:Uncharacterized protein n=1 Tax=Kingdonia uniflora TaxID=39325 RepID=A0A7J7KXZ9_9MAGN|nr:hypothetical protein GIB67_035307 [Kingdonia uniflora]